MRRREFIAVLGGAAAWPVVARGQQPEPLRHIGALLPFTANDPLSKSDLEPFLQRLQELGWVDGRNAPAKAAIWIILPLVLGDKRNSLLADELKSCTVLSGI